MSHAVKNGDANKLLEVDQPVHDWYRFVLSYPPHLVREYFDRFGLGPHSTVLDPFCGTGTTLVEAKKCGVGSIGLEANPMACFASRTKTNWDVDAGGLVAHAASIAEAANARLNETGTDGSGSLPLFSRGEGPGHEHLKSLPDESLKLLLKDSINPLQLHQALTLLEAIEACDANPYRNHERLALAKALVNDISNLHFGPEVGVRKRTFHPPATDCWLGHVQRMSSDLESLAGSEGAECTVFREDARDMADVLEAGGIDAVVTSPPYPNEKDYTRTTRLESVVLGFMRNREDLRAYKKTLLRSNTRNVYKADDDDEFVRDFPEIQEIAEAIERRRKELGKTSGFERTYHRVAKLYFGGMARHFAELRRVLKPGGRLAYVVGDQASYLRVMIRTGQILGRIAERLGYEVSAIDLFRTRAATATRSQLREEVLVLRWPGKGGQAT